MALSLGRVFGLRVVTISQFVQGSHTMLALHDEQLLHVIRVTNASSSGSAGRVFLSSVEKAERCRWLGLAWVKWQGAP